MIAIILKTRAVSLLEVHGIGLQGEFPQCRNLADKEMILLKHDTSAEACEQQSYELSRQHPSHVCCMKTSHST
jgi:hypothetical protein